MQVYERLKREINFYRAILEDPRTPAVSRWCLRIAVAYLLSPIDIIPDFVPVLGQLDDVIVVTVLIAVARYFLPTALRDEYTHLSHTPARHEYGASDGERPEYHPGAPCAIIGASGAPVASGTPTKKNGKNADKIPGPAQYTRRYAGPGSKTSGVAMTEPAERILCVDDQSEIIDLLERHLSDTYACTFVSSGAEALSAIDAAGPFAVVVADYSMPNMDGITLLREVRKRTPDAVPIMLTAYGDIDIAIAALHEGNIFRFLRKPWKATN